MDTLTEPEPTGLDKLRAIDAQQRQMSGLDKLRAIDAQAQQKIPADDPSNFWNAIGVKPGQVNVETQHPYDLPHFAQQFTTGKSMIPGQSFDTIGENIKLQQNPELADRVGQEIARQKSLQPPEMGHLEAWRSSVNPNIQGGYRHAEKYDTQGFPLGDDAAALAGKNPIVQAGKPLLDPGAGMVEQPGEPGSQTMQHWGEAAAKTIGDVANVGFAGAMGAGVLAPAEDAIAPIAEAGVKGFAKRVLKSGAQGAAINAPLSAIDEGLTNPNHLQGAVEGAERGAIGGFALGAGGHALLEGAMSGLDKLRAIDQATRAANPKIVGPVAGALAGGAGGYVGADDDNKLEGTLKGAALGGALGHTYADRGGRIPGLTTEDVTPKLKEPNEPVLYSRLEKWLLNPKVQAQIGDKPKDVAWWDNFFKKGGDFAPKEVEMRLGPVLKAMRESPNPVGMSHADAMQVLASNPVKVKAWNIGPELPHGLNPTKLPDAEERLVRARDANLTFLDNHGKTLDEVLNDPSHPLYAEAKKTYDEWESAMEGMKKLRRNGTRTAPRGYTQIQSEPRYEQYTEPGGEDYSEVAVSARGPQNTARGNGYNYDEPHYGSGNEGIADVVGNFRLKRRMLDGKKTLHVEEMQSTLQQRAAKVGFQDDDAAMERYYKLDEEHATAYEAASRANDALNAARARGAGPEEVGVLRRAHRAAADAAREAGERVGAAEPVPRLPFVDDTGEATSLLWKHVLDIAAREGAERIIWTPGELQAARYAEALQKKADRLHYDPVKRELTGYLDGKPIAMPRGGNVMKASPEELPEIIGKENAAKILAAKPKAWKGQLLHQLRGEDFTVGSKGMAAHYEGTVPGVVQKLARGQGTPIEIRKFEVPDAARPVPAPDIAIGKHAIELGRARDLDQELARGIANSDPHFPGRPVAERLRQAAWEAAENVPDIERPAAYDEDGDLRSLHRWERNALGRRERGARDEARHNAILAAAKDLTPVERDQLAALTNGDWHNLDDIGQHGHEYTDRSADEVLRELDEGDGAPGYGAAIRLHSLMRRGKSFREAVASLSPKSRQEAAEFLAEPTFSPSHPTGEPTVSQVPVMQGFDRPASLGMKPFPLYSNPIGPALKNIYGNPLVGAAIGGGVGAAEDKDNRVRGALAGAGLGAVAGSLGAKGGSIKALRNLYEMPEMKLAADLQAAFKDVRTNYRKSFVTPFAEIEHEYPELTNALREDSRSYKLSQHTGLRKTDWVTENLAAPQKEQFGKALVLDNMETEEARKLQAANDQQGQITQIRQAAAQFRTLEKQHESQAEALRKSGRHTEAAAEDAKAEHAHMQYRGALQQATDMEANTQLLRQAASNWKERADALRPEVDPKTESEPWFQEALAKHKEFIAPLEERAAKQAGVKEGDFRNPRLAYVRLMSEERLRNTQIRSAQDLAARDPSVMQPRSRLMKTLVGEKLSRLRVTPQGAIDPMEGPENLFMQGAQNISSRPREGASRTGSSKMASGTAERYVTDYKTLVHQNALDKIGRGSKNEVYSRLLDSGIGKVLEPGELKASGQDEITRNFKLPDGSIVVKRLQVPPEVAKALDQWEHDRNIQDFEGSRFRRMAGLFTRAQISGMPVEATSHANNVASIVGSVRGEKDRKGGLMAAVPGIGGKAAAIREMNAIDFKDIATRKLESRLADIGALRIEDTGVDQYKLFGIRNKADLQGYADERHGLLQSAHHWLFGPEGVDVRGRLVLARKYLDRKPNATDGELAEFINGKLGNYNRASSGRAINALQDAQFSAFGRFQGARIPTGVKSLFGQSGLPANSMKQKLGDVAHTLYRGVGGYGIGAQLANLAMTGHSTFQNEPGHHFDVQLGNPLTRKPLEIGPDDRPVYAPFSTLNTVAATGARATGLTAMVDPKGYHVSPLEVMLGPENTALGAASPMIRGIWSALLGTAPYVEPDGTFLRTAKPKFSTQNAAKERLYQGLVHLNPALGAFAGSGGDPGGRTLAGALSDGSRFGGGIGANLARVAEFLAPRLANPGVGGRDNASSRDYVEAAKERAAMEQYTQDAKAQRTLEAFESLQDEAEKDMNDAGYSQELINKNLQALERAFINRDRSREKSKLRAERLGEKLQK